MLSPDEETVIRESVAATVAEVESRDGRLSMPQLSALLFHYVMSAVDQPSTDEVILACVRAVRAFHRQRWQELS